MLVEKTVTEILKVNGIKIHAIIAGSDTSKTPLLLLHGFPDFYYSYRHVVPMLSKNRMVIAIDQRGYNLSSRPKGVKNYNLGNLMKDVVEIIKLKSPSNKVILVGHDWGGAIAWHVARFYPEHVEKLIILNCPPMDLLFKYIFKNPRQLLMSYYIFFFQIPKLPELIFKLNNYSLILGLYKTIKKDGKRANKEELNAYISCFNRKRGMSGINYYRAAFRGSIKKQYVTKAKVQCSTLVLWGVKDFALNVGLTYFFKDYVKPGNMIMKYFKAGHFIHQEIPSKVSAEILKFIK